MEKRFCTHCGNPIAPQNNCCGYCGSPTGDTNANAQSANQNQPPYYAPPPYVYPYPDERKSKLAAALLAIFIGTLGIHNFYLGFTGKGLAQLLITVLTCGFGAIATGIWSLIEGIMILTGSICVDAKGIPFKD